MVYKAVFLFKTFTDEVFLGVETLYKPTGFPSFELLTYIVDSNLENIRKVLKDENIVKDNIYGCGDLKAIYSRKLNKDIKTVRVARETATKAKQEENVYYQGHYQDGVVHEDMP